MVAVFVRAFAASVKARGAGVKKVDDALCNEFNFSIDNKEVAELLMRKSGCFVQLHYREFRGKLPWRGHNKFVVDKIEYIKDIYQDDNVIDGSTATPEQPATSIQPDPSATPGSTSVIPGLTSVIPGSTSVIPGSTGNPAPANSEETISL